MMMLLRGLADDGRTVVLVTHATANISQCDLVAFMARGGHLVFFGAPSDAAPFFGVSSGDFADIYQVIEAPIAPETVSSAATARGLNAELQQLGANSSISQMWQARFRASRQFGQFVTGRLKSITRKPSGAVIGRDAPKVSLLRQFLILTQRYAELLVRDRVNLGILLAQVPIIVGLLLVMIKPEALIVKENAPGSRYDAQTVLFMLATVSVWFGIINAAREITKESAIYKRERLVNLRVLPYLASKFVVLSVLTFVQSVLLLGLLALKLTYPSFEGLLFSPVLEIGVTTYLTSLGGVALGLAVSAYASSADRAVSIVPIMLIPQIIFAGLIFKVEGASEIIAKFTASHWAMGAFGSSLDLNKYCEQLKLATGQMCSNLKLYEHEQGFLLERWAGLFAFIVLNLILAAVLLRLKDRVKE
jgi:ABC transport system ATP-binding/permease protein